MIKIVPHIVWVVYTPVGIGSIVCTAQILHFELASLNSQ